VLTIADNGPGIAPVHLPHIFDRFYRVRDGEREEQKGLGLGLSVALWIARAHGGNIEVTSTPGQGATFSVSLPAGLPDGTLPILVANQPN
jgi:two-component system OmpR family sensor kinase